MRTERNVSHFFTNFVLFKTPCCLVQIKERPQTSIGDDDCFPGFQGLHCTNHSSTQPFSPPYHKFHLFLSHKHLSHYLYPFSKQYRQFSHNITVYYQICLIPTHKFTIFLNFDLIPPTSETYFIQPNKPYPTGIIIATDYGLPICKWLINHAIRHASVPMHPHEATRLQAFRLIADWLSGFAVVFNCFIFKFQSCKALGEMAIFQDDNCEMVCAICCKTCSKKAYADHLKFIKVFLLKKYDPYLPHVPSGSSRSYSGISYAFCLRIFFHKIPISPSMCLLEKNNRGTPWNNLKCRICTIAS